MRGDESEESLHAGLCTCTYKHGLGFLSSPPRQSYLLYLFCDSFASSCTTLSQTSYSIPTLSCRCDCHAWRSGLSCDLHTPTDRPDGCTAQKLNQELTGDPSLKQRFLRPFCRKSSQVRVGVRRETLMDSQPPCSDTPEDAGARDIELHLYRVQRIKWQQQQSSNQNREKTLLIVGN